MKPHKRKKPTRPLYLPFTVQQEFDGFLVTCYDHGAEVSVKGLWEKQDTVLDLLENLPRFFRWMKKRKRRSVTLCVKDNKGNPTLYCSIDHASGHLNCDMMKFTATAKRYPNN